MDNKKENIGLIISSVLIVLIVFLLVYFLSNKPVKDDEFEKINIDKTNQLKIDQEKINEITKNNSENLSNNNLEQNSKNMNQNTRILNDFSPIAKADSLKKIDIKEGSGKEVKPGATVSVHYTGALASNGQIFQSSKDFGTEPITFPLGGVIKGWTEGIPGMKVGGVRRLIIPSDMAYGSSAPAGSGIPANADLVFDVELIAVK